MSNSFTGRQSEAMLETLLAEREIHNQIHNYARSMDRCDKQLGLDLFHQGAQVDYGQMYKGSAEGFIEFVMEAHKSLLTHVHRLSNIMINVNGSTAGSETYVHAQLRLDAGDRMVDLFQQGRYIDRWEQREGRWAITHRQYLHEMDSSAAVEGNNFTCAGKRDPSDPSYSVLNF